ncbi:MAG: hypothetical protein HQ596_01270 [Candidatus Saganbacteria bacterium]|nr:hypothetical protein [Candidatus Saganbacteria bacterium]
MKSKFIAGLLIALVLVVGLSVEGFAMYTTDVQISRDFVFGTSALNPDLYVYNISTGQYDVISGFLDMFYSQPRLGGKRIVYSRMNGGSSDIYLFDLETRTETLLTGAYPAIQYEADIFRSKVVYSECANGVTKDIYVHKINTNNRTAIFSCPRSQALTNIRIHGNYVVWFCDEELYLHDLATNAQTIINNSINPTPLAMGLNVLEHSPAVFGDYVVWIEEMPDTMSYEVFLYEISSGTLTRLTNTADNECMPSICVTQQGTPRIVWSNASNGGNLVYQNVNGVQFDPIPLETDCWHPAILGKWIVWCNYPSVTMKMFDFSTQVVTQIN